MIMKYMQTSCSGRQEDRHATVVACYPSGERCPSCDECARYWLGPRPDATWIEPLESYRDPLQAAREALDARRTSQPPPPSGCSPERGQPQQQGLVMTWARIPEAYRNLARRARAAGWTIEHLARHLRGSRRPGSRHGVLLARWTQENQSARMPG